MIVSARWLSKSTGSTSVTVRSFEPDVDKGHSRVLTCGVGLHVAHHGRGEYSDDLQQGEGYPSSMSRSFRASRGAASPGSLLAYT